MLVSIGEEGRCLRNRRAGWTARARLRRAARQIVERRQRFAGLRGTQIDQCPIAEVRCSRCAALALPANAGKRRPYCSVASNDRRAGGARPCTARKDERNRRSNPRRLSWPGHSGSYQCMKLTLRVQGIRNWDWALPPPRRRSALGHGALNRRSLCRHRRPRTRRGRRKLLQRGRHHSFWWSRVRQRTALAISSAWCAQSSVRLPAPAAAPFAPLITSCFGYD